MSEITIRDLSEVKELNEQVMISTVGGQGWSAMHFVSKHPRKGKGYGPKLPALYPRRRYGSLVDIDLNINNQFQAVTVIGSGNATTAVQSIVN